MNESLVIVGTQFGDEGKGKMTDFYAADADVIVRSQGGDNAGHTIVFDGDKYALHLIPSGIFRKGKINVLANGMVINPKTLIDELGLIKKAGIDDPSLWISDRAHVIMPYHIVMDGLSERIRSGKPIGTTKKGIGPTYRDKVDRIGIRMGDLLDKVRLNEKIGMALNYHNRILEAFGDTQFSASELSERYFAYGQTLKPYIADTGKLLDERMKLGEKILFEGAQGTMLCIEHGTYPYVTSSSPTAASVPLAAGVSPQSIGSVLGITKAYSTRVGEGVFPTEFDDDVAGAIREKGHEYGTTTKRPRRIGWLDTVILNHARRINGLTYLAVTLLDVLSGLDEVKICTHYRHDGRTIDHVPSNIECFNACEPVYETWPGWEEDISSCTSYEGLPDNCRIYLNRIEQLTDLKIALFSVGPDREQTVVLKNIF